VSLLTGLLGALGAFTIFYVGSWWRGASLVRASADAPDNPARPGLPAIGHVGLGFVTDFFDTLGIGSYAPTTAIFKFFGMVPDQLIPGTLNVGHTLPTITQAFIYIVVIDVDKLTLILMIGAAIAGAWLGAGIVAGWPKRTIQIGMGFALIVAATIFAWQNLGGAGTQSGTIDLRGVRLAIGLGGNFLLGALMTLGIGLYGPCMILVGLLGMNAAAAFPIMMGSCAFLMPVCSARFIERRTYAFRPALGLAIGGIPAVLIAALIVKSLNVTTVRWLVVVVVLIAAAMMLRSAARGE
jgi:uncharacterized membrane protein YfcA